MKFFNTTIMTVTSVTDTTQVDISSEVKLAYYIAELGVYGIDSVAFDLLKVKGRDETVLSSGTVEASDHNPTEFILTIDTSALAAGDNIRILFSITDTVGVVHPHYGDSYEVKDLGSGV